MELTGASLTWRGLTFHGSRSGGRFSIASLEGWEGLPDDVRDDFGRRPGAHGTFDSAPFAGVRTVTVTGLCRTPDERDAMLLELGAVMTLPGYGSRVEDLTVDFAGRSLTAGARLVRYSPSTDLWSAGIFRWKAQWVCPDPLRYGARLSASTGFPERAGGLRFPLFSDGAGGNVGALDFGAASTQGRVVLVNSGTADTSVQHEIVGPVPAEGFEIVTVGTGARLVFESGVPSGSTLVLDGATGAVLIDGTADRGGALTWRDWAPVPAGSSVEFAFLPRGSFSAAVLTASIRPAFW